MSGVEGTPALERTASRACKSAALTRNVHHRLIGVFALGAFAACTATSTRPDPIVISAAPVIETQPISAAELFPRATGPLHIGTNGANAFTGARLVAEIARLTGVEFMMTDQMQRSLEHTPIGLDQPLEVPPDRVWAVAETLLVSHNFVLEFVSTQAPVVINVLSMNVRPSGGEASLARAITVAPAEIHLWREHAAVLVTTNLVLDELKILQPTNPLRLLFSDRYLESILALNGTRSVVVTGFPPKVAEIVTALEALDERDRERAAQVDREVHGDPFEGQ